ncbi:MAG: hypothetical protein ACLQU4_06095 [Limisphaerales bacterium]
MSGTLVLDLAGQTIPGGTTPYSTSFTANSTESYITFLFRQDPSFMTLYNVDVTQGGVGPNLIANGDFTVGAPTTAGAPVPDWSYFVQAGNDFPQYLGYELSGGGFFDGSTQAYDGIDQAFPTTVGDTYDINFSLNPGGYNTPVYTDQSNNGDTTDTGGDGIDLVVYAGNATPPGNTLPDAASTLALLGAAMTGLAGLRRKLA